MSNGKNYGAVIYRIKNDVLYFLVERTGPDSYVIPGICAEDDDALVRAIGEKTGLKAKLDIVFRHDTVYEPVGESGRWMIFIAAEAVSGETDNREEGDSLQWYLYDAAIQSVKSPVAKDVLSHAAVYLGIKYNMCIDQHLLALDDSGDGIWYREHAVDIHSHIVPQVDDGAKSIGEAMELLRLDWEEGMRFVFATPHYGDENIITPGRRGFERGYGQLSRYVMQTGCPVKISLGTEWYCADDIVERIRNGEAFPMGDTDWYMVEFLEWKLESEPADVILKRLKMMRDNKINTILAHAERYRAIQQDWDLAKRICDMGVLLQVNAYDLFLNETDDTRNLAQWMAKEKLISFIGSDMHGTREGARRPKMKEGIRWLYENVDSEYANEVVRRNAETYLGVDKLL